MVTNRTNTSLSQHSNWIIHKGKKDANKGQNLDNWVSTIAGRSGDDEIKVITNHYNKLRQSQIKN